MNQSQRNYFNMAQAVCDTFATSNSWQSITLIDTSLQKVKAFCADINTSAMQQQQNVSNGHTKATGEARTALEDHLHTISLRLKAWAVSNKETVVVTQTSYSRSGLDHLPLQTLLAHARLIVDICQKHQEGIAPYWITAADITNLQISIDKLMQLNGHRDAVTDNHMENTSHIKDSVTKLREELKIMDTLMEAYISDESFLTVYFNARRIHDVKNGGAVKKEEVVTE